jgi:hypothetical protein
MAHGDAMTFEGAADPAARVRPALPGTKDTR